MPRPLEECVREVSELIDAPACAVVAVDTATGNFQIAGFGTNDVNRGIARSLTMMLAQAMNTSGPLGIFDTRDREIAGLKEEIERLRHQLQTLTAANN